MDERQVNYSFTGNVSSLREATNQAIKLLDQYQNQLTRLTQTDSFGTNQKTAKSFASNVSKITKQVEDLQKKLQAVGDVRLPTGSAEAVQLRSSITSIQDVLRKLSQSSKLSTKEVQQLVAQLRQARQNFIDSSQGMDTFVQREARFQQSLNSITSQTQRLVSTVSGVRTRLSSMLDPFIARLNSLRNPFTQMNPVIQGFRDRVVDAFNRATRMAGAVAAGFRQVRQGSEEASDGASRLSTVWTRVTATFSGLNNGLRRFSESLRGTSTQIRSFADRLGSLSSQMSNLNNQSSNLSRTLNRLFTAAAGVSLGKAFGNAIKESISYVENLNLFTVALGSAIDEGLRFVDTMSELYGMDPSNLYRYAGYFYQLADAIDMTDEASKTLSLSLTKASNDIASLFNMDIETVVENMAAGLQGMTRAVRKYGVDIRTSTLQQTAFNYGLTENVEDMSEANRMALRYLTMMEQVSNATKQVTTTTDGATKLMGDFARNIEIPANQLRIFKEQITQLGRAIGNFFIPILSKVLPLINGFVMALRMALETIAALMGIDNLSFGGAVSGTEEETAAIGAMGDAATDTAKKLKNLTAPFDELNILSEDAAASAGAGAGGLGSDILDPRLQEAIEEMELSLDEIRMKALDVRDALLDFFGFDYVSVFNPDTGEFEKKLQWFSDKFRANLIDRFPQWTKTINAVFDNWSDIVNGFKNVFNSLMGVLDLVIQKLKTFFGAFINDDTVSQFVENLAGNLNTLSAWIDEHSNGLANFVIILGSMYAAFALFTKLAPVFTIIANLVSTLGSLVSIAGSLATIVGPVGIAVGAILLLSSSAESFGSTFISLWENVKSIFFNTVSTIVTIWNTMLKPTFDLFVQSIQSLMDIFAELWDDVIGPILIDIGDAFESVWNDTLLPVFEQVVDAVTGIMDIFMGLWNNVLAPLIEWLISVFGPTISSLAGTILSIVTTLINNIGNIIEGLLTMLNGVIDFVAGVFTGDWERAWKGVQNIFIGFVNTLISAFEIGINFIISIVNLFISALYNLIMTVVNAVMSGISSLLNWLGVDVDLTFTSDPPTIPEISIPRVPTVELAKGGVVTSPTQALIGEGLYDEAVIPLGNSPQMQDLVQQIADAVKTNQTSSNNDQLIVKVYIGGKEYDAFTYKAAKRGERLVGAQPIKGNE